MAAGPKINLLAIVGPTASGKSALAMRLAQEVKGEIIAADSRTIYKDMDIGTAKPSKDERQLIRHWGLDLVEPGQRFSAAAFKAYALSAIDDVRRRNKLPIIVGGTGLYLDSVIFDYEFTNTSSRPELIKLSVPELQELIIEAGFEMPLNNKNKRHLIRTIERQGRVGSRLPEPLPGSRLIGLMRDDVALKETIAKRAQHMFDSGVIAETESLVNKYGREAIANCGGIIYKICLGVLDNEYDQAKATELFKTADWQYARRQRTWFKRNIFIQWYSDSRVAYTSVMSELNNLIG